MMTLTPNAIRQLIELKAEEPNAKYFRVFVQGGGCSGFQYGFTFDDQQNDDDFVVVNEPELTVLVDSISMNYLDTAEVDYKEDLMGASFTINNPNAQTSCGCGSSFSM